VKERKGAIRRATQIAESVVAGVKRRQQARAPRVLLYDAGGRPRTLDPASGAAQGVLDTAGKMLDVAGPIEDVGPDPLEGDPE